MGKGADQYPTPPALSDRFGENLAPYLYRALRSVPFVRPVGRSHRTVNPSGWQPQRFTHPGLKAYFRRLATVYRRFAQSLVSIPLARLVSNNITHCSQATSLVARKKIG